MFLTFYHFQFPSLENDHDMNDRENEDPVLLLPDMEHQSSSPTYDWAASNDLESSPPLVSYRKYGSGLANLGNTCFMNSMLQSLAHTPPLMKYFLTGAYEKDINRDNPLGTGGDLTTQFAELMSEIWGLKASRRFSNSANVVYPRDFKYTLGKHAEQFVGYDQHDSQEFVTFLLDALHEDTNRVRKKPYVEKPEQGENESDQEAADKAWSLYLKRDDSQVLDYFMGQIKSRVQCCDETCNRVSTTYDPFMYLSVPVPGSSDRTIKITFVPLNQKKRRLLLSIKIDKNGTIADLLQKIREKLKKIGYVSEIEEISIEDLLACDVWHQEIYTWYESKSPVDEIRDTDITFVYQLHPKRQVREAGLQPMQSQATKDEEHWEGPREKFFKEDLATSIELRSGDAWMSKLSGYLIHASGLNHAFGRYGKQEYRIANYHRLTGFIDGCVREIRKEENTSSDGDINVEPGQLIEPTTDENEQLRTKCDRSTHFKNVRSKFDVMVLECCAGKMAEEMKRIDQEKRTQYPDGFLVQVRLRKKREGYVTRDQCVAEPLVLRLPQTTSVADLRTELARVLSRAISDDTNSQTATGQSTSESEGRPGSFVQSWSLQQSAEESFLQRLPLHFERKSQSTYRSQASNEKPLGSVDYGEETNHKVASKTDPEELELVGDVVGDYGTIYVDVPADLLNKFDGTELDSCEDFESNDSDTTSMLIPDRNVSVYDCIEKYCQKEQLEETEMWYCGKCKKHVQAWKQFHLYRAPPILIVHLKRFQFSARTHRRDKISLFVDFPLEGLDLTEHVMSFDDSTKPVYDCYAVSNHFGGLGGGHYTAYCLNEDGKWCYYDDSRITEDVDPKEVVSSAAYVLYYKRRDVDSSLDFLSEVQTSYVDQKPAVIGAGVSKSWPSSEQGSEAAVIGDDDNMETCDGSTATSPMQSAQDEDEYGTPNDPMHDLDGFPLQ